MRAKQAPFQAGQGSEGLAPSIRGSLNTQASTSWINEGSRTMRGLRSQKQPTAMADAASEAAGRRLAAADARGRARTLPDH